MKLKKLFSTVIVMVLLVCYVPALAFAEEYDLSQGSIEVSADESGQYVSQVDAGFVNVTQTSPTIISQSDSETPTQNTISISATGGATAEVTLDGVNIDESGTGNNYNGEGAVTAVSVSPDEDSTVIIELDGENTVKSGRGHAGVENNDSNLVIQDENKVSGSLDATGGAYAAGIGGGYAKDGSNITINSGTVNASCGAESAGIGGGRNGNGTNITINGGKVTATGQAGAGIGGGLKGKGDNITINDGSVVASSNSYGEGAGIGGGSDYGVAYKSGDQYRGRGSDVTISGDAHVKVIKNALMIINDGYGNKHGHGAWIGDGGSSDDPIHGTEIEPDTSKLTVNGWVEYWHQYAKEYDHNITGTYVPPEPVLPVASAPEYSPLFRIVDANGADLGHSAVIENGVLTITAAHDFAVLAGALSGVDALMQQGVDTIVFITSGAGSAFELSALRAAGSASDIFRLTHDGEAVTLTLDGEALDGVLK